MLLTSPFRPEFRVKRNLLVAAAALLVSCQLVALALIAEDQVQKASVRQAQHSVQRAAIAQCLDIRMAAQRSWCLSQAQGVQAADGKSESPAHHETVMPSARFDGTGTLAGGPVGRVSSN